MSAGASQQFRDCNCLAVRQAGRSITRFYDKYLAPLGLRSTQFSILARLKRIGPVTINALAEELVMDRTTLGRNLLPLCRDGLVEIFPSLADRRSKTLSLTPDGVARFRSAAKHWRKAQAAFEARIGAGRAADMRALLGRVARANQL